MIRRLGRLVSGQAACALYLLAAGAAPSSGLPAAFHPQLAGVASPIQHVVVVFQENHSFEHGAVPSWGAPLGPVAAQFAGFTGNTPGPGQLPPGRGWGCDSNKDTGWAPPGGSVIRVPSCVPKPDGSGPYRPSPVPWVPT